MDKDKLGCRLNGLEQPRRDKKKQVAMFSSAYSNFLLYGTRVQRILPLWSFASAAALGWLAGLGLGCQVRVAKDKSSDSKTR